MVIFHRYVSLPEGNGSNNNDGSNPVTIIVITNRSPLERFHYCIVMTMMVVTVMTHSYNPVLT